MAESLKRGLRERPKKRNFDSQNEEGEHYSYIKTYAKEFVNPSQQLNQEAKLLIKFINTINRNYNEFHRAKMEKENEASKAAQAARARLTKGEESARDGAKRNGESGKVGETDGLRKGKQISSNIAQNKGYQKLNHKNQDFLSKIKDMALASASSMLELEKTIGSKNPNSQGKRGQMGAGKGREASTSKGKQKEKQKEGDKAGNKFQLGEQKIFKRSAYHVAIAYHIFLSQKSKVAVEGSSFDPTYPARKLKEQMSKQ